MTEYEEYFPAPEYKVSWYFFQEIYAALMQHIDDQDYHYRYRLDKEEAKWFPRKRVVKYYQESLKNNLIKRDFIGEIARKAKEEVKDGLNSTR